MKTIPWSLFITSLQNDNLITKIDGLNVLINLLDDNKEISIFWDDNGEEYAFTIKEEDNKEIPNRENELFLQCDDYDVDSFTFSFYSIAKHFFNE